MVTHTLTSSQAQNQFSYLLDTSQREAVAITRHGRVVSYVMSPEVLEDLMDGALAMEAAKNMLTAAETQKALARFL